MATLLHLILRSEKTVFSFKELVLLTGNTNFKNLNAQIRYYIKKGELYHVRRGLYAKDKNYDRFEVATKILRPAYISFETVLAQAGIIFQYYSQIFVASYRTESILCDGQTYTFRRIKSPILTNSTGITIKDTYSISSPERAFLDVAYLHKDYHFDNLSPLNWDKVYDILPIYGGNKRMEQMVARQHSLYKSEK